MPISIQKASWIAKKSVIESSGHSGSIIKENTLTELGFGDSLAINLLRQKIIYISKDSGVKIYASDLNLSGGTTYYKLYTRIKEKAEYIPV